MSDDDKSREAIYIDALHELANEQADRIEKLEAALRYVDSKIYINDYGNCALASGFDDKVLYDALAGEKKND